MQLFQRYDHALKRARLRQYLFEGARRSRMSIMIEVVPALIHISLFLFFMGLADFLFHVNTTAAIATVIPIALCATFYIWGVIGPVIRPQSAYQTPFSGLFWYLFQRIGGRKHRNHGLFKSVNTNMAEGRMQLAMDETDDRLVRDARAIVWLINNRTEESEIQELVLSVPTSFNTPWGVMAWRTVAQIDASDEDRALPLLVHTNSRRPGLLTQPLPEIHEHSAVRELYKKVRLSLQTCRDPGSSGEKLRRARACIESIALLAIHIGASMVEFGDLEFIMKILANVGETTSGRALQEPPGVTRLAIIPFEMHFIGATLLTCRAITGVMVTHRRYDNGREEALERCQTVDRLLRSALRCMRSLSGTLGGALSNGDEEQVRAALRGHEMEIGTLDNIRAEYDRIREKGLWHFAVHPMLMNLCSLLPGASLNISTTPSPWIQTPATRQLVSTEPILQTLAAFGPRLRAIIEDTDATSGEHATELAKELPFTWVMLHANGSPMNVAWERMEERRYWRIEDYWAGGKLGFFVELFFITLKELLPEDPHAQVSDSHRTFYTLTFRALTSDWRQHKHSEATQRVLLDLLCDTLIPGHGIASHKFPDWAMNELLALLKKIFPGQRGSHIDDAVWELETVPAIVGYSWHRHWREQALDLLRGYR
ncbi:hypothetical protein BC834DRAFT_1034637 [Gloeopeniophorella convolvens]|nr:hypothetical protein BC834DRAFT_1034637 [Gloeopeniophorella convolvens]